MDQIMFAAPWIYYIAGSVGTIKDQWKQTRKNACWKLKVLSASLTNNAIYLAFLWFIRLTTAQILLLYLLIKFKVVKRWNTVKSLITKTASLLTSVSEQKQQVYSHKHTDYSPHQPVYWTPTQSIHMKSHCIHINSQSERIRDSISL